MSTPERGLLVFYGPEAGGSGTYEDFFTAACAGRPDDMTLSEVIDDVFSEATEPSCADYLEHPESEVWAWFRVAAVMTGSLSAEQAQFTLACTEDPSLTVTAAAVVAEAAPPVPGPNTAVWETASELGYTINNQLHVGNVQGVEEPHPERATDEQYFVAGAMCNVDPSTDILIPLTLRITNTTSGYETTLQSRFMIGSVAGERPTTTQIAVIADYAEGARCFEPDYTSVVTGIQWQEPAVAGDTHAGHFFVVVRDFYSPRYPDGNFDDLGRYEIRGVAPLSQDDPTQITTSDRILLNGSLT